MITAQKVVIHTARTQTVQPTVTARVSLYTPRYLTGKTLFETEPFVDGGEAAAISTAEGECRRRGWEVVVFEETVVVDFVIKLHPSVNWAPGWGARPAWRGPQARRGQGYKDIATAREKLVRVRGSTGCGELLIVQRTFTRRGPTWSLAEETV